MSGFMFSQPLTPPPFPPMLSASTTLTFVPSAGQSSLPGDYILATPKFILETHVCHLVNLVDLCTGFLFGAPLCRVSVPLRAGTVPSKIPRKRIALWRHHNYLLYNTQLVARRGKELGYLKEIAAYSPYCLAIWLYSSASCRRSVSVLYYPTAGISTSSILSPLV